MALYITKGKIFEILYPKPDIAVIVMKKKGFANSMHCMAMTIYGQTKKRLLDDAGIQPGDNVQIKFYPKSRKSERTDDYFTSLVITGIALISKNKKNLFTDASSSQNSEAHFFDPQSGELFN